MKTLEQSVERLNCHPFSHRSGIVYGFGVSFPFDVQIPYMFDTGCRICESIVDAVI